MGMTVKAINEALEVQLAGFGSEFTVVEGGLELASSVKTAALILPKHVEHLLDACKGIFEPGKEGKIKWGQC
jgi:hypothetical protein